MPVPDHVRFVHTNQDEVITYGDVRKMSNPERLVALKKRLDFWLIEQVNPLAAKDEAGNSLVSAPFPLLILSCVTLETLGNVFFGLGAKKDDPRETFEKAAIFTDKRLKGPMEKGFKSKMRALWPNSELDDVDSASDVIYKFFRNSMLHGYRARGVYLTGEIAPDPWRYDDGYLLIHPVTFWNLIRDQGYYEMMKIVLSGSDSDLAQSAIKYVVDLLA